MWLVTSYFHISLNPTEKPHKHWSFEPDLLLNLLANQSLCLEESLLTL